MKFKTNDIVKLSFRNESFAIIKIFLVDDISKGYFVNYLYSHNLEDYPFVYLSEEIEYRMSKLPDDEALKWKV